MGVYMVAANSVHTPWLVSHTYLLRDQGQLGCGQLGENALQPVVMKVVLKG